MNWKFENKEKNKTLVLHQLHLRSAAVKRVALSLR